MTFLPGIDVSLWDGDQFHIRTLDWKNYTWPYTFIKVSEGIVIDPLFARQWRAARGNVVRGAYHFFRPSVDPKQSAIKTKEYLAGDLGELPLAFDLEVTEGMSNVLDRAKTWLSWYEAMTGIRPIIYSGQDFLENVLHAANYPYLANYKLWLAQYPFDNMEPLAAREKRIADVVSGAYTLKWPATPAPFKDENFKLLQWTAQGKPAQVPGYYTGKDGKKEVDLIAYRGGVKEFEEEFGVSVETPDYPPPDLPTGETMQGKVLRVTNLRANKTQFSTDQGDLFAGDIVTFTTKELGTDGLTYCLLTNATRDGAPVRRSDGKTVAEANCWAYAANIEEINPTPTGDKPKKVTVEMESGKVFVADQFTEQ